MKDEFCPNCGSELQEFSSNPAHSPMYVYDGYLRKPPDPGAGRNWCASCVTNAIGYAEQLKLADALADSVEKDILEHGGDGCKGKAKNWDCGEGESACYLMGQCRALAAFRREE